MHLPEAMGRRLITAASWLLVSGGALLTLRPTVAPAAGKPVAETLLVDPADMIGPVVTKKQAPAAPAITAETNAVSAKTQQATRKEQSYTVAEGDVVEAIAARFGLKTETVLWANDLAPDDFLSIGHELIIPALDGVVHQVAEGDTLLGIAEKYHAHFDAIVRVNPEVEPGNLVLGQKLLIPGGEPEESRRRIASSRGGGRSRIDHFDLWPTQGPITDGFGWRVHPVYGTRNFHDGMDIGVSIGMPLHSVAPGTVVFTGRYGGYGLTVKIDHGGGVVTQYSHMSQIDVSEGQVVGAGDYIGDSGNTGVSTGPHLHFMVIVDGTPINPVSWLP